MIKTTDAKLYEMYRDVAIVILNKGGFQWDLTGSVTYPSVEGARAAIDNWLTSTRF